MGLLTRQVKKTGANKAVKVNQLSATIRRRKKTCVTETISFLIKGRLSPIKSMITREMKQRRTSTRSLNKEVDECKMKNAVRIGTRKKVEEEVITKKRRGKSEKAQVEIAKTAPKVKTLNSEQKTLKKNQYNTKQKLHAKTDAKVSANNRGKNSLPVKKENVNSKRTTAKVLRESSKITSEKNFKKLSTVVKTTKKAKIAAVSELQKEKTKPRKINRKKEEETTDERIKEEPTAIEEISTSEPKEAIPLVTVKKESEDIKQEDVKPKLKRKPGRKPITATKIKYKPKPVLVKKPIIRRTKTKLKDKVASKKPKMKLVSVPNGPKRPREAALNASAKVHCLYENESRSNTSENSETVKSESSSENSCSKEDELPRRTLRSAPGLRAYGKHWDMDDETFSSSDESSYDITEKTGVVQKSNVLDAADDNSNDASKNADGGTGKKRRRNRAAEPPMNLKDMVVSKRRASEIATAAILAARFSTERRWLKRLKCEDTEDECEDGNRKAKGKKKASEETVRDENDESVIEVCATPNKKMSVILNQDTDVTITGVYLNSTTRSTHHEGYCSIAGMQYRISATSHTSTAATAVATETILQPSGNSTEQDNNNLESPCKSYTPLGALSSMQPPGGGGSQRHGVTQHVPASEERQHSCSSAFSAPPQPIGHHPHAVRDSGYLHGFYQPAGPLITVPHGHGHTQSAAAIGKSGPDISPTISPLPPVHPPAPSSTGDSSDNEVIITSVTTAKDSLPPPAAQQPSSHYRIGQYPTAHHGYSYAYPHQYYPSPHAYAHHDLCYSPNPYLHPKYSHTSYRRYLPSVQYYQHGAPDLYNTATIANQQSQQVVSANPAAVSGSTFQPPPATGPPPPTLLDTFPPPAPTALVESYPPPPPPPPHYYPGYGPAPPPSCYTHSPPTRSIPYLNAATYQTCPCPMQSCPKNGLTGPLTGESKRSNISSIAKESVPLPPVASLALPLEPASATGPPSPARGSAGMPPPPSPAGATYQSGATPKIETSEENGSEKPIKKARVGKAMVRNNIAAAAAAAAAANTMLLMCHPPVESVKREVESPKENTTVLEEVQKKEPPSPELPKTIVPNSESTTIVCKQCEVNQEPTVQLKSEDKETAVSPPAAVVEEVQKKYNGDIAAANEPCLTTVAETVKVKNMKRKVESLKEPSETTYLPSKRQKVEKTKTVNGSYKNLIKKNANYVKINNGKRKLTVNPAKESLAKGRSKTKRTQKRKLSPVKEETTVQKRLKTQTKPLAASNLHNSKQNTKECKDKIVCEAELTENKEPAKKTKKTVTAAKVVAVVENRTDCGAEDSGVVRTYKCKSKVGKKNSSTNSAKIEKPECPVSKRKYNKKNNNNNNIVIPEVITKPRRSLQCPRWSNGWIWEGEPYEARVFINSDEVTVTRKCYPRMRHKEGDLIEPRDCVLLKAGPRKNDLPFVAKVAALWESPEDGEMMMSLLWYYRPEHTEQGRQPADQPDEVFASRHKDSNSVACIEDKCYVLTFNEYCRYRKNLRRLEEGIDDIAPSIPIPEPYPRLDRQPPTHIQTPPDLVFFCRRVYDFRQKRIVKNPS